MVRVLSAIFLAFIVAVQPARADEEEDKYLQIVETIQQADSLKAKGQTAAALSKYQQAQSALRDFRRTYSDWNTKVVAYRVKYVAEKIEACNEKVADSAEPNEPSKAATAGSAEAGMQVKLLEAGSEPRQVLRLHPKPGDKQTLNMTITSGMEIKVGEMENPPMKLPGMIMTMDVTVQEVSDAGEVKYETLMTDATTTESPGVMPQVAEAIKASFAGLKGLSGTGVMTSRGLNKGTEIKMPSGADPQIQQTMEQLKQSLASLSTPLPEEAVGAGAKWEAKTSVKSQGMTIDQVTTYELVSVNGEMAIVKAAVAQNAANQKVQSPAMPGLKVDLTKMTGTGTGEIAFDLTHLLPQKGTLQSHSELSMGMNAGGQKQAMSMKMDLNLLMEAK